jgi:mannosyltransferase OCH1-like enzyme
VIPKRLVRTVPEHTTDQVEGWWAQAIGLHPDWEHVTWREPVYPEFFPLTGHLFDSCESGAQKADLIRAEDLWWRGGIYLDSDVEVFKALDPFLGLSGCAGWEDAEHICNAVMAFEAAHPALEQVLKLAIQRHSEGTWAAGVGVFTEVMATRDDVLLLPPGTWFPYHYKQRRPVNVREMNPWAYTAHHWSHSWK